MGALSAGVSRGWRHWASHSCALPWQASRPRWQLLWGQDTKRLSHSFSVLCSASQGMGRDDPVVPVYPLESLLSICLAAALNHIRSAWSKAQEPGSAPLLSIWRAAAIFSNRHMGIAAYVWEGAAGMPKCVCIHLTLDGNSQTVLSLEGLVQK